MNTTKRRIVRKLVSLSSLLVLAGYLPIEVRAEDVSTRQAITSDLPNYTRNPPKIVQTISRMWVVPCAPTEWKEMACYRMFEGNMCPSEGQQIALCQKALQGNFGGQRPGACPRGEVPNSAFGCVGSRNGLSAAGTCHYSTDAPSEPDCKIEYRTQRGVPMVCVVATIKCVSGCVVP